VRRGSFFHRTECFGPVLGLMRAADLDEAIDLANDTPFGLTSGIHSLDDREVGRWLGRLEAGNLYVNRHITGAIVGRQPFGGWKASSVGPGAKAGGPNYVLQLARWQQAELPVAGAEPPPPLGALLERCVEALADTGAEKLLRASAASYARAWREHFAREHETARVLGERNVLRYRPCRGVLVRADGESAAGRTALAQVVLAARTCEVPLAISLSRGAAWPGLTGEAGITVAVEREAELIGRGGAAPGGIERLRALEPVSLELRAAARRAGITVIEAPVLATGRLELLRYLREQTVGQVLHRHGNVTPLAAAE
jgi:RHH-type proline utilization regulon transcriptional repressor/proline dehydrogenase/delta 1-pyrroline-5-carboxylate dehydrogenase